MTEWGIPTLDTQYSSSFEDRSFLERCPLNKETVIHYFARSLFAKDTVLTDVHSTNTVSVVEGAMDDENSFLIKKDNKASNIGAEYFYCVGGIIYAAPPVTSLLSSRAVWSH